MWSLVLSILAATATRLQLTSEVYDKLFSSTAQSLLFLASEDKLYAAPDLQTYSILFWLQLNTPLPTTASVLSLYSRGKEALTVRVESGQIVGKSCSACGECVSVSVEGPSQAYKWVHVGVAVDCLARNVTLTVTPWKLSASSDSARSNSPLLSYLALDTQTNNLTIGGFAVIPM